MKCVWIALTAARFLCASDFALQEYLPPDTKVVMGLRVSALTESSLFQENSEKAKQMSEGWTKLVAFTGFDPLHDVDEVLLTSPADRDNAPALLVVRGRFNLEKLGDGTQRYHGVAIHKDSVGSPSVLALLDANTALAGDLPAVKAAIDRHGQAIAYDGELLSRVASLRERFDIWGTGERAQGFVAPGGKNEQLNSIDRFEFGLRITHGLELGAEIHARSHKDAEALSASLAMLQMMAKGQSNAAQFDMKLDHDTLKLSFAISEEELKKAIAAQRSQMTQSQAPPKITGQPLDAAAPPKPQTNPAGTSVFTLPGKQ